jgi:uncharacterized membrane protein YbhN (UPF0104 family)
MAENDSSGGGRANHDHATWSLLALLLGLVGLGIAVLGAAIGILAFLIATEHVSLWDRVVRNPRSLFSMLSNFSIFAVGIGVMAVAWLLQRRSAARERRESRIREEKRVEALRR